MRLKDKEIQRIAKMVIKHLAEKKLFEPKRDLPFLENRIVELLMANMQEEADIDNETKKMMEQYDAQIKAGQIEYHKMYRMIKQQLAKDRNFVL